MIIFNILLAIVAAILFMGVVAEKDEKKHKNITLAFVSVMAVIIVEMIINAL